MILKGNPVSSGVAVGKVYIYKPYEASVKEAYVTQDIKAEEIKKFHEAIAVVDEQLQALTESLGDDAAKIKI
ncbi:MAG TPA: phosphoenolpyruvate--protein phosphotransferase, partial [Clostridiales bacterium]|nr:phosphoenolpyruvate--protein phosphotransferase [Clostridiales bacterium]